MSLPDTGGALESRCSRCGAPFHCGIDDRDGCWCARMPPLPLDALEAGHGCLCPACMDAVTTALRRAPG
ncbi:MAG: cysteine-rich CWC family protein [Gemmatimonadota bacterium]